MGDRGGVLADESAIGQGVVLQHPLKIKRPRRPASGQPGPGVAWSGCVSAVFDHGRGYLVPVNLGQGGVK